MRHNKISVKLDLRYAQKIGQNGVPKRFFEKITRNMILTEKIQMTKNIGNFYSDNIVFGPEVLADHHVYCLT